jgi:hypothetical protein
VSRYRSSSLGFLVTGWATKDSPVKTQPTGGDARRSRLRLVALGAIAFTTVVSLILRLNAPLVLQTDWHADDALFTEHASYLLSGQWLGPYNLWTVAKGPGYPLFIAAVYKAHLLLVLAQHLVHLVAAAAMATAVARIARSRSLGVVIYCVLALDPSYLGRWGSTVSRDVLYGPVSLLVIALALLIVAYMPSIARRGGAWLVVVAVAGGAALGVTASLYYLTRDERPWLVPTLLAVAVVGAATWRRDITDRATLLRAACGALAAVVIAGGTFAWSVDQVADRNEAAYGTRVTSDLAQGEIVRAFAEWQRVDVGEPIPMVQVTRAQMDAVFDVSPTAAELEPLLTTHLAARWIDPACFPPVDPTCEYGGGWVVWALREAAQLTGHMTSGADGQRFFGRLADEIADACDDGRLRCVSPGFASMPPLARIDEARIVSSLHRATTYLFSFDLAEPSGLPRTSGTEEEWAAMIAPLRGVAGTLAEHQAAERRAAGRQQAVAGLTDVYRWAARLGAVPALVGFVVALRRRRRRSRWPMLALAAVLAVAVASRVFLLALVDMTSFHAATWGLYILPAVEFLLVLLVLGWWMLGSAVRECLESRRGSVDPPSGTEHVEAERVRDDGLATAAPRDARLVPQ